MAEWKRQRDFGEWTTEAALRKALNAKKGREFPWMYQATKSVPQQAIKNLGRALLNFRQDLHRYNSGCIPWACVRQPKFKKKGSYESFRADNGTDKRRPNAVKIDGKSEFLPLVGWVRMREEVRFLGRILAVIISRQADRWYASFSIEVPYEADIRSDRGVLGVDLGITAFVTTSAGWKVAPPRPLKRYLKRLRSLSRSLSRKKPGSNNRAKAKTKLARLYRRIENIRLDFLHKLSRLMMQYRIVVIEDLKVRGVLKNRRLSRSVQDLGWYEFRRQLRYKTAMAGSTLVIADRWFPSSKLCSACGSKNKSLSLRDRQWTCVSCGTNHDRDLNASLNLALYPESSPGFACGAEGRIRDNEFLGFSPSTIKQEDVLRGNLGGLQNGPLVFSSKWATS